MSGNAYTIYTEWDGTKYYLTKEGELTSNKANAGVFTLTKRTGGEVYTYGIRIATSDGYRFSNPSTNNRADVNNNKKLYRTNDTGCDRDTWERQVFRMDGNGNYAIRTTNTATSTSGWPAVAGMYWTVYEDDNTPYAGYTNTESEAPNYSPDYRWHLDTTPPLQLSNSKVYTIRTTRGYVTLNTAQTMLVSSHTTDGGTVNSNAATDDASKQFGILNIDGKYFIYSPKVNKFAEFSGWGLGLYTDRGTALYFTGDGSDNLKHRIFAYGMGSEGDKKFCLNDNNSGDIKLNTDTTASDGNRLSIEEVEGVTLDTEAALAVWNGTPDYFDPHKVYNITNSRITHWTANEAGTGLTGTSTYSGASAAYQQFAFFKFDGKPCLYNVGTKKFVAKDGTLTSSKSDVATISVWHAGDATYPYCFFIEERGLLFNAQDGGGFAINAWNNTHDAGNKHGLTEVADLDAYDEAAGIYYGDQDITYHIKMGGVEVATETRTQKYREATALSAQVKDYMTYTYEYDQIPIGTNDIDVTATWNGPFDLSASYAEAAWHYLRFDKVNRYLYYDDTASHPVRQNLSPSSGDDAYLWAFVGNPYDGIKVHNKAAGSTMTIVKTGSNTIDVNTSGANDIWTVSRYDGSTFYLSRDGQQFNCFGGDLEGAYLGLWSANADNRLFAIAATSDDYKFVTYILKYNNIEYAREYEMKPVGAEVSDMPSHLKRSYIDYSLDSLEPLTVTAGGANEINVTTTLASSSNLNLFPDYASIDTWKNLKVRRVNDNDVYYNVYLRAVSGSGDKNVTNAAEAYRAADDYQWAFVGNPYQVKVYNKATGSAKTLARVDGFVYLTSDTYVWDMLESIASTKYNDTSYAGAVTLRDPSSNNDACINEQSTKLAMWESYANYYDRGSALLVEDVPTEMMGSEGLLTSGEQITSNSTESDQFTTDNLLRPESDGYGTNQYIWHSRWSTPTNEAGTYTYLQAQLDEARTDFYFTMLSSEWGTARYTPNDVVIYGSNDGSNWTEVTHLKNMIEEDTHPTRYTSPRIHAQTAYSYWKFEVRETINSKNDGNGNPLVSLGRFQMYPPVPAEPYDPADYINLVFIGNSITAGAGLTAATEAPPVKCGEYVETATGKTVGVYNGGNSGKTTVDFLPDRSLLPGVLSNAGTLGTNGGKMYFSIMLGTNDSAESGTTGAPVSTSTYQTNMELIIDSIIAAFPESKIIVNYPIWYSDNTHNGATYEAAGQARLHSYYPIIDAIAGEYSQVHAGDRNTWELFKERTNLFQAETYSSYGPFYLHPNATGADFLGQIWAKSLLGLMEADGMSTDQTAVPICWREGLTGGNFGTICLPYSVAEGNLKGATFYKIASKTNGCVNLEEVTSLTAGYAYLYEVEEGKTALQMYGNAETTVEEPVEASESGTGLTGAFVRTAIPVGKYMLKNNTLYYVDLADYAYVGANKAYIDASAISDDEAGVKILSFFEGDDPTAISTPTGADTEHVYTLNGVRLQGTPRHPGVYVVKGKKVIIK